MEIDWDTADAKNASMLVSSAVGFARGSFNFGLFDQGMKELKAALKFLDKLPPSPPRTRLAKKVKDMATYGRRLMDLSAQQDKARRHGGLEGGSDELDEKVTAVHYGFSPLKRKYYIWLMGTAPNGMEYKIKSLADDYGMANLAESTAKDAAKHYGVKAIKQSSGT